MSFRATTEIWPTHAKPCPRCSFNARPPSTHCTTDPGSVGTLSYETVSSGGHDCVTCIALPLVSPAMSWQEQANGAAQGMPKVYRPSVETEPEYHRFADPAAAHGWENAYDETRELPVIPGAHDPKGPDQGRGARRRARPARGPRVPRQVVAVGVLGSVGLAVVFAVGLTSGSSGTRGGVQEPAQPNTARSVSPTEGGIPSSATGEPSGTGAPALGVKEPPPAGAPRSDSRADSGTPAPSSASSTVQEPTATTTGRGNINGKPARGRGATKGPK